MGARNRLRPAMLEFVAKPERCPYHTGKECFVILRRISFSVNHACVRFNSEKSVNSDSVINNSWEDVTLRRTEQKNVGECM
jgi:hypothetical protein